MTCRRGEEFRVWVGARDLRLGGCGVKWNWDDRIIYAFIEGSSFHRIIYTFIEGKEESSFHRIIYAFIAEGNHCYPRPFQTKPRAQP